MLDRRTLFPALTGLGTAIGAVFASRDVKAASPSFKGDLDPRGTVERLERLPDLNLESQQDFLTGFRTFTGRGFRRASADRKSVV